MPSYRWISLPFATMTLALLAQASPAGGVEPAAAKRIVVEYVTGKPARSDTLGTTSYEPSEKEAPFFKRLAKGEVAIGDGWGSITTSMP